MRPRAIALGWDEGVEVEEVPLVVSEDDGYLVERIDPLGRLVWVVTKVDGVRFSDFWLEQIRRA